jgi:hypothetical protein
VLGGGASRFDKGDECDSPWVSQELGTEQTVNDTHDVENHSDLNQKEPFETSIAPEMDSTMSTLIASKPINVIM